MLKDFIWFVKNSYSFVVTDTFESKITFVKGFIPAWCKFRKLIRD